MQKAKKQRYNSLQVEYERQIKNLSMSNPSLASLAQLVREERQKELSQYGANFYAEFASKRKLKRI